MPYRQAAVVQVNERDPDRRAAIERASLDASSAALHPLLREMFGRAHAPGRERGWPSMRVMCEELSGIDLVALERQTSAFQQATEDEYEQLLSGPLERELGFGFERL